MKLLKLNDIKLIAEIDSEIKELVTTNTINIFNNAKELIVIKLADLLNNNFIVEIATNINQIDTNKSWKFIAQMR